MERVVMKQVGCLLIFHEWFDYHDSDDLVRIEEDGIAIKEEEEEEKKE